MKSISSTRSVAPSLRPSSREHLGKSSQASRSSGSLVSVRRCRTMSTFRTFSAFTDIVVCRPSHSRLSLRPPAHVSIACNQASSSSTRHSVLSRSSSTFSASRERTNPLLRRRTWTRRSSRRHAMKFAPLDPFEARMLTRSPSTPPSGLGARR